MDKRSSRHIHIQAKAGPQDRLTLVLEKQDLHAIQGEGLSEAVRH